MFYTDICGVDFISAFHEEGKLVNPGHRHLCVIWKLEYVHVSNVCS